MKTTIKVNVPEKSIKCKTCIHSIKIEENKYYKCLKGRLITCFFTNYTFYEKRDMDFIKKKEMEL